LHARTEREKLLTKDRNIPRCFDPEPDFAAINVDHGDAYVLTDADFLPQFAAQNKHIPSLLTAGVRYLPVTDSTSRGAIFLRTPAK
jgi:hypothetical protein